jgi:hypothetical protein
MSYPLPGACQALAMPCHAPPTGLAPATLLVCRPLGRILVGHAAALHVAGCRLQVLARSLQPGVVCLIAVFHNQSNDHPCIVDDSFEKGGADLDNNDIAAFCLPPQLISAP